MNNFAEPHIVATIKANYKNKVSQQYTAAYLIQAVGMDYLNKTDYIQQAYLPALTVLANECDLDVVNYATKVLAKTF